jgi:hypothetical protein
LQVTPVVAPSAPGKRPNRWSNVRFSFTMKMTWSIRRRAMSIWDRCARTLVEVEGGTEGLGAWSGVRSGSVAVHASIKPTPIAATAPVRDHVPRLRSRLMAA